MSGPTPSAVMSCVSFHLSTHTTHSTRKASALERGEAGTSKGNTKDKYSSRFQSYTSSELSGFVFGVLSSLLPTRSSQAIFRRECGVTWGRNESE